MKKNKGVTLVALVITIVVLLIVTSIALVSGGQTITSMQRTNFITKLQTIQAKVDYFAEKKQEEYENLGQPIENLGHQERARIGNAIGTVINSDFRYFTPEDLEQIEVKGVDEAVIINFKTRQIASINGFVYNEDTYYTLEQLGEGKYIPKE